MWRKSICTRGEHQGQSPQLLWDTGGDGIENVLSEKLAGPEELLKIV